MRATVCMRQRRRRTTTAVTTARQRAKRWRRPVAVGGRNAGAALFGSGRQPSDAAATRCSWLLRRRSRTETRRGDAHRLDQSRRRRRSLPVPWFWLYSFVVYTFVVGGWRLTCAISAVRWHRYRGDPNELHSVGLCVIKIIILPLSNS